MESFRDRPPSWGAVVGALKCNNLYKIARLKRSNGIFSLWNLSSERYNIVVCTKFRNWSAPIASSASGTSDRTR